MKRAAGTSVKSILAALPQGKGSRQLINMPVCRSGRNSSLTAALLFGASTPLAEVLTGNISPLLVAGLLYLGSGLGLGILLLARRLRATGSDQPFASVKIPRGELPWRVGAIVAGGMLGPTLLMLVWPKPMPRQLPCC